MSRIIRELDGVDAHQVKRILDGIQVRFFGR